MACVPATSQERFRARGHLLVVADGMGAHAAGELASHIATEKISMHYLRSPQTESVDALHEAVTEANSAIFQRGQSNPEFHNMGTTASALALLPQRAIVAHVGDSRVYRLRGSTFEQLTFDHSLVWEMEASAELSGSVIGTGIPKNVITRSLGPHETVEVDIEGPFPVEPGDQFLICSDGLTGLVEDAEIGVLVDCLPVELATRVLVDLANLRGGPDNITVVIASVDQVSTDLPTPRDDSVAAVRHPVPPWLLLAMVVCLIAACLLAVLPCGSMAGALVAGIMGLIATVTSVVVFWRNHASDYRRRLPSGGKGPYRKYDARPTKEMYERLGATVTALREAADENNWMLDWSKIERFQSDGNRAVETKDFRKAIRCQAEAIIETMHQLRRQRDRAASETTIDLQ